MTPYRPLAQPVRTREARAAGITRATLREGGFRRVRHGTYLPADADQGSPDTRIAIAAASLSPRGTIGGWAAARLHELAQLDAGARVEALILIHGVARDLERVGDHATNIAEDVAYLADGTIIRHAHAP